MEKTVCELFAGVGGFGLGLKRLHSGWNTVWFSQWEPGAKTQWAHDCYVSHFGDRADMRGEYHTGEDISLMDKSQIPDHNLLVGGFPCQDYSVACTLSSSKGIEGKKGVLWWQIRDTLLAKRPAFGLFENVDRLLKSPSSRQGRDFGIILACLWQAGYSAEWRVVDASSYGAVQRRKRTFIFAWRDSTAYGARMAGMAPEVLIGEEGLMAKAFPVSGIGNLAGCRLSGDIAEVSAHFSFLFGNAGYMTGGMVHTCPVTERKEIGPVLGDILENSVPDGYLIPEDKLLKWEYLKGAKKIERVSKSGHAYTFSEGAMSFPDSLDKPGRTMLTSESTMNRSTHVVEDLATGRLRTLTPLEAERMQGFDDGWTDTGMTKRMRFFCMGNALVVPMVTRMGRVLDKIIENEP